MQEKQILQFHYSMELDFSEPVQNHQFTLRMIPQSDERQQISECSLYIEPDCAFHRDTDAFGNQYAYGEIKHLHSLFRVEVCGTAAVSGNILCTSGSLGAEPVSSYRFASKYTKPGNTLRAYYKMYGKKEDEDALAFSERILHQIYRDMAYVQGATTISTTAEEALAGRQGVCQDYAHIMLSLCRMADIPGRYVVGMMQGEGYSHAWVEVCTDGSWHGMDPTNDKIVDDTYIKISHGRDYQDCIVNRGVFRGAASQVQKISVIVKKSEESR